MVFDENKIKAKNVAISISGNSVIIKKISLPAMEKEELAESIVWEAKHNIPYPYEETNVDYAILRPPRGSEEKTLDILLVAAKKDKIANYSNVVHQARKNLMAIDVDVFALQNALEVNYPDLFQNRTVAIINIGANITNVVIVEKGTSQLFRDLSLGGFFCTENMRKELNVSFDDAEKMLKGIPVKDIPVEQVDEVVGLNIRDLLDEIDKTFSFFEAGEKKEKKIEHILLSGGLANLKHLPKAFEDKFKIRTEIFNPFTASNSTRISLILFIFRKSLLFSAWPSVWPPEKWKNNHDQNQLIKAGIQGPQGERRAPPAGAQGKEAAADR